MDKKLAEADIKKSEAKTAMVETTRAESEAQEAETNAELAKERLKQERLKTQALERAEFQYQKLSFETRELALTIEAFAEEVTTSLDHPNEAIPIVVRAVTEVAELHQASVVFLLQSNAPAEVAKHFPQEALPGTKEHKQLVAVVKGLLPPKSTA